MHGRAIVGRKERPQLFCLVSAILAELQSIYPSINQSIRRMTQRYELTEFPEILKDTYWGQGPVTDPGASHPSVVQNYNDFVRAHSIVRALDRVPLYAETSARVYWTTDASEYSIFPATRMSGTSVRRNVDGVMEYACFMQMGHGIDHLQYFQDRSDNYVFITSPYRLRSDGTFLIEHGWERVPGLHIVGESSYMFKVLNLRRTGRPGDE